MVAKRRKISTSRKILAVAGLVARKSRDRQGRGDYLAWQDSRTRQQVPGDLRLAGEWSVLGEASPALR